MLILFFVLDFLSTTFFPVHIEAPTNENGWERRLGLFVRQAIQALLQKKCYESVKMSGLKDPQGSRLKLSKPTDAAASGRFQPKLTAPAKSVLARETVAR